MLLKSALKRWKKRNSGNSISCILVTSQCIIFDDIPLNCSLNEKEHRKTWTIGVIRQKAERRKEKKKKILFTRTGKKLMQKKWKKRERRRRKRRRTIHLCASFIGVNNGIRNFHAYFFLTSAILVNKIQTIRKYILFVFTNAPPNQVHEIYCGIENFVSSLPVHRWRWNLLNP